MINGSTDLFLWIFLDPEMQFLWDFNPCGTTAPLERYYRLGRGSKKLLLLEAWYYHATPAQYYHGWSGCNFLVPQACPVLPHVRYYRPAGAVLPHVRYYRSLERYYRTWHNTRYYRCLKSLLWHFLRAMSTCFTCFAVVFALILLAFRACLFCGVCFRWWLRCSGSPLQSKP